MKRTIFGLNLASYFVSSSLITKNYNHSHTYSNLINNWEYKALLKKKFQLLQFHFHSITKQMQ